MKRLVFDHNLNMRQLWFVSVTGSVRHTRFTAIICRPSSIVWLLRLLLYCRNFDFSSLRPTQSTNWSVRPVRTWSSAARSARTSTRWRSAASTSISSWTRRAWSVSSTASRTARRASSSNWTGSTAGCPSRSTCRCPARARSMPPTAAPRSSATASTRATRRTSVPSSTIRRTTSPRGTRSPWFGFGSYSLELDRTSNGCIRVCVVCRFYPYLAQDSYRSPFILVYFKQPQQQVIIMVECRVYAKNIVYNEQFKDASVRFELLID